MTIPDFMQSPERGCAKADPDIFFASARSEESIESGKTDFAAMQQGTARWVCRSRCPFTTECFIWAEASGERHGIWGGVNMGSPPERDKARVKHGLTETAPVAPESDEVLAERILAAGPAAFKKLDEKQRSTVVRAGVSRGLSLNKLSKRFRCTAKTLRSLIGEDADSFDQQVRRMYHTGKSDQTIALLLDCNAKAVAAARSRLGLAAIYGPGGRLRRRIGDAQKARRERVPA